MFSNGPHPNSSAFNNYAARIESNKGNAPGLSHDFRYLDPVEGRLNNNPEYLDVRPEHANAIVQARYAESVAEQEYSSMVPDLPFDEKGEQDRQSLWKATGLGFLLVGIIYFTKLSQS